MTAGGCESITCALIEIGSLEYAGELRLRDEVLRKPLGRPLSATESARDAEGRHFGALLEGEVVGCVGLYPQGEGIVRLRHMAVAPRLQGQGIGSTLLAFAEAWARTRGIKVILLHARITALPFYERCFYVAEGEAFIEVTVPHRKMSKTLG